MDSHVKSISTDERSKKKIRFASARERSKRASADVYRSFKGRQVGVTSAATREEFVHNPSQDERAKKRQRTHHSALEDKSRSMILRPSKDDEEMLSEEELELEDTTTFASELDVAMDRNSCELFGKLHRKTWSLVRSLPEVLHHADKIIDLLLTHMLSPASSPGVVSDLTNVDEATDREGYVLNHATTDILHLLAVLARDLRHEIHPHLHEKIIPRIIKDMLNPPPPESGKQSIPLDVTIVEAAFRTLAYIFRYDSELLLKDMEPMRTYYGITLANRRELVRRMSAETFAPLIRKMKSDSARQRHLKRVLRALAASGDQPATNSFKRTQADAVDGISQLLFQVVRGVPGRLHSKGSSTVKFLFDFLTEDNESAKINAAGKEIVYSITSAFVQRVCHHVHLSEFDKVWRELLGVAKKAVSAFAGGGSKMDVDDAKQDDLFLPVLHMLKLISQVSSFRSGSLLNSDSSRNMEIFGLIEPLCKEKVFKRIPENMQCPALSIFCTVFKGIQNNANFDTHLSRILPGVLVASNDSDSEHVESLLARTMILTQELLPSLTKDLDVSAVGSEVLKAASRIASNNPEGSLMVVFAVATTRINKVDDEGGEATGTADDDLLFFPENAVDCEVSPADKERLVQSCLFVVGSKNISASVLGRLGVALRCAPFLTLLGRTEEEEKQTTAYLKKTLNWIVSSLTEVEKLSTETGPLDASDLVVIKSLALESLARLSLAAMDVVPQRSILEKYLLRVKPAAEKLLFSNSGSIWAMKSIAAFVEALQGLGFTFNDKTNEAFDALMPNLRCASHFLRLHTLQILTSYPQKPYVTDHADLDLEDDLDEEPSSYPTKNDGGKGSGPSGPCDIMETLLSLEMAPIAMANERKLMSLISRIEVLGRMGKMPVAYAEAAANHMLGTFYVRFSPLWTGAARALVALASGHEACVWPALESKLVAVMEHSPDKFKATDKVETDGPDTSCDSHHRICVKWETSEGKDVSILRADSSGIVEGRVSCHEVTDGETVMESVWNVAEHASHLLAKHSRVLVPAFLAFLHDQYYFFHSNDPDARELHLDVEVENSRSYERILFDRYILQRRLTCFLKAFAAVDGPQQLVKHTLLKSIFVAFLSHQDTTVVQLALSGLLKYKPPYLLPYADQIKNMLKKGGLRDALLQFGAAFEGGDVYKDHRVLLIPVVSKILFGRLSARVKGSKSSKDSPAARRASILSFLSVMCTSEDEIYPFMYFMTRSFLPKRVALKPIESFDSDDRSHTGQELLSVGVDDISHLPGPVYEGYLNLLEAVISQLGHRVVAFVPHFTSIILALCKLAEVKTSVTYAIESKEDDLSEKDFSQDTRYGPIRSLCFHRLSDIFGQFAAKVDFTPYADALWAPLGESIQKLPEMVLNSENAPSLLVLLQTISSHPRLILLLQGNPSAVVSVFKCISDTSLNSVINCSLTFVENLLTNAGTASTDDHRNKGVELVRQHIPLLLEQFTMRLRGARTQNVSHEKSYSRRGPRIQMTWRRELDILCRISELVSLERDLDMKDKEKVMESLCSLLVPFLEPGQTTSDPDKLNVLGILKATVPMIGSAAKLSTFTAISHLLAPFKAKPGISSLSIRRAIATVVATLAESETEMKNVAGKLVQLSAAHPKRIDEMDYDVVIPELSALSDDGAGSGWLALCDPKDPKPSLLAPVISSCFHLLFDEDGVISRGAFNALTTIVKLSSERDPGTNSEEVADPWMKLMQSSVIPMTKAGLRSKEATVRRRFILILSEISRAFRNHPSPNLYGDLYCLIRDDNQDLDFFLSITHVQLHRRARALQRLRKSLNDSVEPDSECSFTPQSLSNILLPLAMHPIYECKMKTEESFALEAIATVGAISRLLSWSKYNSTLWTTLNQFDRHPEQERYLIGMVCAIIDGFHFDVNISSANGDTNEADKGREGDSEGNGVWRSLERRIIPKIEGLLTKEKVDRKGKRVKTLRPTVVLALLKLFQKFPERFFHSKLPRLLAVICDALRNKDSDARDVARNTMAKMVVSMDLIYLADVIRELAITLTEGYKLHVRSAVVHTILLELLGSFKSGAEGSSKETSSLAFDKCVAPFMNLIQEDLFGVAQERKDSQDTQVRYVKEAGGSKSVHSVEMICRIVTFKPSDAARKKGGLSAIHCVVSPLLERLRLSEVDTPTIRKIREILARVSIGLSHNTSVTSEELLPFVYATVQPFVGAAAVLSVLDRTDDDASDDDEGMRPIKISGSKTKQLEATSTSGKVVEWRPSTLKTSKTSKDALDGKSKAHHELLKVQDGASAPKLTGSSRHAPMKVSSTPGLNDPASVSAVVFGLNLLSACLKKMKLNETPDFESRMDPFLPLLTACVCHCRDTDVALVALKCLMSFLRFDLPSIPLCAKSLGTQTLKLLSSSGASSNHHDLTQACFKTLTYIIALDRNQTMEEDGKDPSIDLTTADGEKALAKGIAMPLDPEQMQVLIAMLKVSIAESEQHNPALGLIKAITSRSYVSPEFYDLMDTMLKMTVRSQKASLRQVSIRSHRTLHESEKIPIF
jgi:hypothetical protein